MSVDSSIVQTTDPNSHQPRIWFKIWARETIWKTFEKNPYFGQKKAVSILKYVSHEMAQTIDSNIPLMLVRLGILTFSKNVPLTCFYTKIKSFENINL